MTGAINGIRLLHIQYVQHEIPLPVVCQVPRLNAVMLADLARQVNTDKVKPGVSEKVLYDILEACVLP